MVPLRRVIASPFAAEVCSLEHRELLSAQGISGSVSVESSQGKKVQTALEPNNIIGTWHFTQGLGLGTMVISADGNKLHATYNNLGLINGGGSAKFKNDVLTFRVKSFSGPGTLLTDSKFKLTFNSSTTFEGVVRLKDFSAGKPPFINDFIVAGDRS
jgi:hypothetical protein